MIVLAWVLAGLALWVSLILPLAVACGRAFAAGHRPARQEHTQPSGTQDDEQTHDKRRKHQA